MPCHWNNADNKLALFGLTDDENCEYEEVFEHLIAISDFITDMLFFDSVLHEK